MKKLLGVLSVSLWMGALMFSPAPAEAFLARYPTIVDYFACAQYATVAPVACVNGDGERISFGGAMQQTIPISACAGSCNGTENLLVKLNIGNGRKVRTGSQGQCGGGWVLVMEPCTSCS